MQHFTPKYGLLTVTVVTCVSVTVHVYAEFDTALFSHSSAREEK